MRAPVSSLRLQAKLVTSPPPAASPRPLEAPIARYLATIAPAYSARTIGGLASDWRLFSGWCLERAARPLPASPETVAAFVAAMALHKAPTTIRRYLASLAHLHRAFGHPNPVAAPSVRLAWRALARRLGIRPSGRRAPLRRQEAERIVETLGAAPIDLRDRALLLVARDSLARRSELAALTLEDIAWEGAAGGGALLIRRSKADPEGEGRLVWLSPATMAALRGYLARTRLADGPLFRRFGGGRPGAPLSAQGIARRFKTLAARAGLDAARIAGHSTRLGMTLDLVGDGQSLIAVQLAGGWRSPAMPALYARQLLPELGAVARYYERHPSRAPR